MGTYNTVFHSLHRVRPLLGQHRLKGFGCLPQRVGSFSIQIAPGGPRAEYVPGETLTQQRD